MTHQQLRVRVSEIRILIPCPLPLGQAVFVTNTSHQVPQTCDPSTRFFSSTGHQVQRLHVFSVIQAETAVWVKAAVRVTLEDLWLFALTYLSDGVNGDCDTQIKALWAFIHMRKSILKINYRWDLVRDFYYGLHQSVIYLWPIIYLTLTLHMEDTHV